MRRPIFKAPPEGLGGIASFPFGWDGPVELKSSGNQEV